MTQKNGQVLIMLLVFSTIALVVISAATGVIITNATSTTKMEQSMQTYAIAESGIENAILRLLRNPNHTGENVNIGGGTAAVSINDIGGNQKEIISTGTNGNFLRKIRAVVDYTGNVLNIVSWKEI